MKKVNNWINFILAFAAVWYGYYLIMMIVLGLFVAVREEGVGLAMLLTSDKMPFTVLAAVLLVAVGGYLGEKSVEERRHDVDT